MVILRNDHATRRSPLGDMVRHIRDHDACHAGHVPNLPGRAAPRKQKTWVPSPGFRSPCSQSASGCSPSGLVKCSGWASATARRISAAAAMAFSASSREAGGMVIPQGDHVPTFPPALRLQRRRLIGSRGSIGQGYRFRPLRSRTATWSSFGMTMPPVAAPWVTWCGTSGITMRAMRGMSPTYPAARPPASRKHGYRPQVSRPQVSRLLRP